MRMPGFISADEARELIDTDSDLEQFVKDLLICRRVGTDGVTYYREDEVRGLARVFTRSRPPRR
jgi:hypothetical protein